MSTRREPAFSAPTRLALLALALVAGATAGAALAERDRPLPRRSAALREPAGRSSLGHAVFGVG